MILRQQVLSLAQKCSCRRYAAAEGGLHPVHNGLTGSPNPLVVFGFIPRGKPPLYKRGACCFCEVHAAISYPCLCTFLVAIMRASVPHSRSVQFTTQSHHSDLLWYAHPWSVQTSRSTQAQISPCISVSLPNSAISSKPAKHLWTFARKCKEWV